MGLWLRLWGQFREQDLEVRAMMSHTGNHESYLKAHEHDPCTATL